MKLCKFIEWVCPILSRPQESKDHFFSVLQHLDEMGIPYVTNTLVRGLEYYTETVFKLCLITLVLKVLFVVVAVIIT